MSDDSILIGKGPCEACGSSDARAKYTDGSSHCFSCDDHSHGGGKTTATIVSKTVKSKPLLRGEYAAIPSRKISAQTCKVWGYRQYMDDRTAEQSAPYHDEDGNVVAEKVRGPNKSFSIRGNGRKLRFYGQDLWSPRGTLTITEGEMDAMSVYEAQGRRHFPVVSLPSGASAAERTFRQESDWLSRWDKIVIMFDNDEPGQEAAVAAAALLRPGQAYIAKLPMKDANEMLVAGKTSELQSAFFDARPYRPDGIVDSGDITVEELMAAPVTGYSTPYPQFDEMLGGVRKGELTMFTAGTGVGKSTIAREIAYHFNNTHDLKVGNVYLEESVTKTAQGYIAMHHGIALADLRKNPESLTPEQYAEGLEALDGMTFFRHFGSLESDNLLAKLRYLAVGVQVDFIVLDHISIVVSGMEGSGEGERRDIDKLMTALRSLVEETGVGILAICHLSQPEGTPHEEGGRVNMSKLRGSGSIKQLSDSVVALERDQQGDNPTVALVRVLKNREIGTIGEAGYVRYDFGTGRLLSHDFTPAAPTESKQGGSFTPTSNAF